MPGFREMALRRRADKQAVGLSQTEVAAHDDLRVINPNQD
jgi:hypothetical protein